MTASLQDLLGDRYFGTTLGSLGVAVALACVVTFLLVTGRRLLSDRLRGLAARTETKLDDVLVVLLGSLRAWFFVAVGLWAASERAELAGGPRHVLRAIIGVVALLQLGLSLQAAVRRVVQGWTAEDANGDTRMAASATTFLVSLSIWAVLSISALSLLGFQISALVAGLGVGGVAAALAVQNVLGDLFASLSIYFDRPFQIGDFIIVGDDMGTVERIGLRTTRLRSLGGEELVFGNADLTKSRLRNYKRMEQRRVVFTFGIEYDTPLEQLEQVAELVRAIIDSRQGVRFDRAHFKSYGEYSLDFEVVYYVLSADYTVYMDHQHAINLQLFREFAARGIQFAFPTQKLLLVRAGRTAGHQPQAPAAH